MAAFCAIHPYCLGMTQSKIRNRRGFKILGAAATAAFALMVTAGCNNPAPAPEQQQEQNDTRDLEDDGGEQPNGGGEQPDGEQEGEQEGDG
jgi:hypothetical protein